MEKFWDFRIWEFSRTPYCKVNLAGTPYSNILAFRPSAILLIRISKLQKFFSSNFLPEISKF